MAKEVKCPDCGRKMGGHCPGWRCRWALCPCGVKLDLRTGKWIAKGY